MIEHGKLIYLCKPNREIIVQLNGIDTSTVSYSESVKDYNSITFTVDRYINIDGIYVESNCYDMLHVYMELYLEDIGYFQMQEPSISGDGYTEKKTVTAYSLEKQFEDKDLVGFKINTGDKDSREYIAEGNVNELGFAKEYVLFYRKNNPELSLMHILLEKMPGWTVDEDDIDPLLRDMKYQFDEDNINIYGFMTSVLAPKAECVFLFDTINRKIKAISKHSLDLNTNIFIGFRNLANSIDVSCEEDSVYTRFHVMGKDNITLSLANFDDERIFDYSYFMTENYMSKELIQKMQNWISYRESRRESFISASKELADVRDKISEIENRVPNDGDNWKQWDEMTKELLEKNLKYYTALLTSLQVSVDDDPQYEDPDTKEHYIPWKTSAGSVDHKRYMDLLYQMANGYGGYYTYLEVNTYIIPNIKIAIENYQVPEDDKKDYIKEFETNWDLYGTVELENLRSKYEEQLESLKQFEKDWKDLSESEQAAYPGGETEYNTNHSEYVKIKGYIGSDSTPGTLLYKLAQLKKELTDLEEKRDSLLEIRKDIVNKVSIDNPDFNFTNEEKIKISDLTVDTDYTNSNILATSLDTTSDRVDIAKELFDDASSKLSEACQPQYSFTTEMDNLLVLPEFKEWEDDFKLLNYIWLGIRDDYSVKLRLIGRSWNPCDTAPEITVTFSNMITSKSGRSDLTDVLESENNRGSKNSISIGTGDSKTEEEWRTNLLKLLISSQLFQKSVGNIASGVSGDVDTVYIQQLVSKYIKTGRIDVSQITGDEAHFKKFFTDYMDADYIVSNTTITKDLSAKIANIKNAIIGTSSSETNITINLNAQNAVIDAAWIASLIAKQITVADLAAHKVSVSDSITLISSETGKPLIAFKAATQQFYDSDGNVRVQIGQDGNEKFNFIVMNKNGDAALFDENGITKAGIPDNTIVENMISDGSVTENKLSFNVTTDDDGNIITNIENVYSGDGQWIKEYESYKESTKGKIEELSQDLSATNESISSSEKSITQIQEKIKSQDGIIESKVSQDVFDNTLTGIRGDIENANQGLNKWLVELYNIDDTASVVEERGSILPEEKRSLYTIDAIWGKDVQPYNTFLLSDRDIYLSTDPRVFSTYGEKYIGYAYTFVYCPEAFKMDIAFRATTSGTLYINAKQVLVFEGDSITYPNFLFKKGWNSIEIIWNTGDSSGEFTFTPLYIMSEITLMNCYFATPTARQNVSVSKVSDTIIDVDGIKEKVKENSLAIFDEKGNNKILSTINRVTEVEKLAGEIQTNLENFQGTVKDDYYTSKDVENRITQSAESMKTELSSTYLTKVDGDKVTQGLNRWILELYQYDSSDKVPDTLLQKSIIGKPVSKILEEDDSNFLDDSGKINENIDCLIHAQTYVYFTGNESVSSYITYNGSISICLNGLEVFSKKKTGKTSTTLTIAFKEGWNVLEIWGGKNHYFKISTAISQLEKCQIMNCYASFSSTLKEVTTSSLFYREIFNDAGKSRIEQMSNQIGLILDDGSDETSLTLKNGVIEAITKQLVIKSDDDYITIANGAIIFGTKNTYNSYLDLFDHFPTSSYDIPIYSSSGGLEISLNPYGGHYGEKRLDISVPDGGYSGYAYLGTPNTNYGCCRVESNKMFCLSFYVKCVAGTAILSSTVVEKKAIVGSSSNNRENITSETAFLSGDSPEWMRISVNFKADASYPYMSVKLILVTPRDSQENAKLHFDAFMLEEIESMDQEPSEFIPAKKSTYITSTQISVPDLSSISADLGTITSGIIKSRDYTYTSGNYSTKGLIIDLNESYIQAPGFYLSKDGKSFFKGEIQATSGSLSNLVINENVYIKNKIQLYYNDTNFGQLPPVGKYGDAISVVVDELGVPQLLIGRVAEDGTGFQRTIIDDCLMSYLSVERLLIDNKLSFDTSIIKSQTGSVGYSNFYANLYELKNCTYYCLINCQLTSAMSANTYNTSSIPANYTPTVPYLNTFITRTGKKFIFEVTIHGYFKFTALEYIPAGEWMQIGFTYV